MDMFYLDLRGRQLVLNLFLQVLHSLKDHPDINVDFGSLVSVTEEAREILVV